MSDIIISALEGAIRDGITLLSQRLFRPKAPPFLLRPRAALNVQLLDINETSHKNDLDRQAKVHVRCVTWGDTDVTLVLTEAGGEGDWLVWGDASIRYGVDYPIARLTTKRVKMSIGPYIVSIDNFTRPLAYRITSVTWC